MAIEATNDYHHCSTCRKISKMDSQSFVRYRIRGKKMSVYSGTKKEGGALL